MTTAAFNKFQDFSEQLIRGVHDFDAHVFKIALTNTAPVATNTILANITQVSAGNGYTTGGTATTISVSETSGTTTVSGTQVVFTASGGTIGPFRYAVLYNDSATSPADALIGWWDYATSITLADTETFTWRPSNASPGAILTIS
jgi:hypothetical protein